MARGIENDELEVQLNPCLLFGGVLFVKLYCTSVLNLQLIVIHLESSARANTYVAIAPRNGRLRLAYG